MNYKIEKVLEEIDDIINSIGSSIEDNLIKIRLKLLKDEIRSLNK